MPPVQAYCDLLEVRWLLSERAGADVGDAAALAALAAKAAPAGSAASLVEVEDTGVTTRRGIRAPGDEHP